MIEAPAQPPVLADGLFMHYEREPTPIEFETQIRVPNINCERCTVQVIQWMAEHAYNNPGGLQLPSLRAREDHGERLAAARRGVAGAAERDGPVDRARRPAIAPPA